MKIEDIIKTSSPLSDRKRLVLNLMISTNQAATQISDVVKPFDISTPQFNVLRILRGQKGKPANLSTIQDRMVTQMSNTTRLVDKLLEKKLVKRSICKENRRKIEIFITENGLDLLKKLDPVIENAELNLTRNLTTAEIGVLNELLEKLRT